MLIYIQIQFYKLRAEISAFSDISFVRVNQPFKKFFNKEIQEFSKDFRIWFWPQNSKKNLIIVKLDFKRFLVSLILNIAWKYRILKGQFSMKEDLVLDSYNRLKVSFEISTNVCVALMMKRKSGNLMLLFAMKNSLKYLK